MDFGRSGSIPSGPTFQVLFFERLFWPYNIYVSSLDETGMTHTKHPICNAALMYFKF